MFYSMLRDLANIQLKNKTITVSNFSNMLIGGGLCYAMENEKYFHIPIIILFPSIFTGYNIYKNRREIYGNIQSNRSFYIPPFH